jgi:hypothetical protein
MSQTFFIHFSTSYITKGFPPEDDRLMAELKVSRTRMLMLYLAVCFVTDILRTEYMTNAFPTAR